MALFKIPPFTIIRDAPRHTKPSLLQNESNSQSGASLSLLGSYNRKEKSLEELSRKFLQMFLNSCETYISLDKITEFLGVERRRIYDIINILESLNLVTRKGKNNYRWNGFHKVYETIHSFDELDINQIKGLFLRWKNTMSLEEAAKSLSEGLKSEDHKIKTKIRRLYDIANVFKSLGLIRKTVLLNKKPAFHWIGIKGLDEFVKANNKEKSHYSEEEQLSKSNAKQNLLDREFLMKCLMSLLDSKNNIVPNPQYTNEPQIHQQHSQQSFVTPTIKRTLTIIYPKTEETQTPPSLEHSHLKREVAKEFEGFSLKECTNELKRRPLMTLSQGLGLSRKSSFKKIKRCEEETENKENMRPVIS